MTSVLIIFFDLLLLAMIILIFLYFRLDRSAFHVDMCWRGVKSLLCAVAAEKLESGKSTTEEREEIEAFVKSRKQAVQVARANQLQSILVIPEDDAADLAERCKRYNDDVRRFNQKLEQPLWHFVATMFRVKPRLMVEMFDGKEMGLNPGGQP